MTDAPAENVRAHGGRMALFAGVGVANTVLDFAVFGALLAAGAPPLAANVGGFLCANLQSYLLNGRITFRRGGKAAPTSIAGYGKFAASHLASLGISSAFIAFLSGPLGAFGAKAASALFTFLCNYASSAFLVFAPRKKARRAT